MRFCRNILTDDRRMNLQLLRRELRQARFFHSEIFYIGSVPDHFSVWDCFLSKWNIFWNTIYNGSIELRCVPKMGHIFDRLHHTSGSCESRDQKEEFYEGGNLCFWGAEAVTTRRAERFGWAYRSEDWQSDERFGKCTNVGK